MTENNMPPLGSRWRNKYPPQVTYVVTGYELSQGPSDVDIDPLPPWARAFRRMVFLDKEGSPGGLHRAQFTLQDFRKLFDPLDRPLPPENITVLRLLEYSGPRDLVENVIAGSLQGTNRFGALTVRVQTVPEFSK